MASVLVVDDERGMRETLRRMLEREGHQVTAAGDVKDALHTLEEKQPDVVVTDIVMPGRSGVELAHAAKDKWPPVKVILITGEPSLDTATDAIRSQAFDYLAKPVDPGELLRRVNSAISVRRLEVENRAYHQNLEQLVQQRTDELSRTAAHLKRLVESNADGMIVAEPDGRVLFINAAAKALLVHKEGMEFLPRDLKPGPSGPTHVHLDMEGGGLDLEVCCVPLEWEGRAAVLLSLRNITERKRAETESLEYRRKLEKTLKDMVRSLSLVVEMRDPYTAGHQQRVTELASAIAEQMGLPEPAREGLRMAGILHDIGKIVVPAEILSKPSRLTDIEFALIKTHSRAGFDLLKDVDFPWPIARMVAEHHERMDGSGYPAGKKGDEILLESRILAVADVVEAMASHRPYRPALPLGAAMNEISSGKGSRYDATVVDACLQVLEQKKWPQLSPPK